MLRVESVEVGAPGVGELLADAVGGGSARVERALGHYRAGDADLLGVFLGEVLVGVAGYRVGPDGVELLHIATRREERRRGVGRYLVGELGARVAGAVVAETDRDSLGFYLSVGFEAVSLGEKYPGVERFLVRWERGVSKERQGRGVGR